MTNYYVDPAAGGSNNGTDWTNAWTDFQTAFDTVQVGSGTNVIYCRGTQTLSAAMDVDAYGGTNAAGFIKVIGCNSSGNVDGTRFIFDCNNAGVHGLRFSGTADMYWMENIEVKNTGAGTYHGFSAKTSGCSGLVLINCCANNCGANGFGDNSNVFVLPTFWRCVAYSNGGFGYKGPPFRTLFCCARDNTDSGVEGVSAASIIYGCVIHGNGDDGIETLYQRQTVMHCVIDGNDDDGISCIDTATLGEAVLFGCRITNHSGSGDMGVNANSDPLVTGFCYFEDNDGNNVQNDTLHYVIPIEGGSSSSNMEDLANTDEGYTDRSNHNFTTRYVDSGDPDLRRVGVTVPWS